MRFARHIKTSTAAAMSTDIGASLRLVRQRIAGAHEKFLLDHPKSSTPLPRLVAVSKTKPAELLQEAYDNGQRCFGENYVQELVQKANHFHEKGITDIEWHFIGLLQRNKVNNVLSAPNLSMVETVESIKLADALNKSWAKKNLDRKLKVMVQVNTSDEESKSGCHPTECVNVVDHVRTKCPALQFCGLMTIGSFDHNYEEGPNPDFLLLVKCRQDVCEAFGLSFDDVELSMGMSGDFEHAIQAGSSNIRVGSTIFGARTPKVANSGQSTSAQTPPSSGPVNPPDVSDLKIS